MSYVKSNLLSGEQIVYWTRPHWIVFYPFIIAALCYFFVQVFGDFIFSSMLPFGFTSKNFVEVVIIFVAILQGIKNAIYYFASEYAITSQRVLMKVGFIERRSFEIFLKQIEGIAVNQTVSGRILNYGTIFIIGIGGSREYFPYIPSPLQFRTRVQQRVEMSPSK